MDISDIIFVVYAQKPGAEQDIGNHGKYKDREGLETVQVREGKKKFWGALWKEVEVLLPQGERFLKVLLKREIFKHFLAIFGRLLKRRGINIPLKTPLIKRHGKPR